MMQLEDVTVTDQQRMIHVVAESIAVFAVVPFMIWLATRKDLPTWARVTSGIIAGGTILIDGGLLWKYAKTY